MEHLQHFGLSRDPFANEPIPDHFLDLGPHRDARLRLERAVRQRKGLCLLTGEVGCGKTMVARQLLDTLEEEVFDANMMVVLNASADAAWIMTRFARLLGIEEPRAEREALVAQIYEQLAIVREDGRHALLLIDDAEALAGGRTLADVCGLLKLEYEDRRLLTLVLAGGPPLSRAVAGDPGLAGRVEVRVELQSLDRAAAREYLERRIQAAGGAVAIVHDEAMDAIHRLSRGLPGRINTLADNALFEAFLAQRNQISAVDVQRAHRDLAWSTVETAPAAPDAPVEMPAVETAPVAAPTHAEPVRDPGASIGEHDVISPESPGFDQLDSELDAAFAIGGNGSGAPAGDTLSGATFGNEALETDKPEDDDDVEDLLVELIEE